MRCCAHENIEAPKEMIMQKEGQKSGIGQNHPLRHLGVVIENRLQVYSSCFI